MSLNRCQERNFKRSGLYKLSYNSNIQPSQTIYSVPLLERRQDVKVNHVRLARWALKLLSSESQLIIA